MNKTIYKIVFAAGFLAFAAVASGSAMMLHLHCCNHHHEQHDSEHCPLCQQILTVNKHSLDTGCVVLLCNTGPWYSTITYNQSYPVSLYLEVFQSRAPPVYS